MLKPIITALRPSGIVKNNKNMPFIKGESGNKAGRPKGAVSTKVALKNLLEEVFLENQEQARELLTAMFKDEKNFKWLCELKASMEPKEFIGEGFETNNLILIRSAVNAGTENQSEALAG